MYMQKLKDIFSKQMCFIAPLNTSAEATYNYLLPTGSEEREVLWVRSIPVAILPSCQDMKTIAI